MLALIIVVWVVSITTLGTNAKRSFKRSAPRWGKGSYQPDRPGFESTYFLSNRR